MAIFEIDNGRAKRVKPVEFEFEKDLQKLVESNLETFFNCRFVASEFYTGINHSGRIDTLALSEDNNPVIIEYKKIASSHLINQSLYYRHWINDHKGDFQLAVNKALGMEEKVNWSSIRVICLAPEYRKYDLYAVREMGANIELWNYRLYDNGLLNVEVAFKKSPTSSVMIEANHPKPKTPALLPDTDIEGMFWRVIEHQYNLIIGKNEDGMPIRGLRAGIDYVFISYPSGASVTSQVGKGKFEPYCFLNETNVIHIRFSKVYSRYIKEHLRQFNTPGAKDTTLRKILKSSDAYIGNLKNIDFQEIRTTAMAFNWNLLSHEVKLGVPRSNKLNSISKD